MGLSFREWLRYSIFKDIKSRFELNTFKRRWRRCNRHNGTFPMNVFPIDLVSVGNASYGELNVVTFDEKTHLKIGNYVSISQEVRFMLDVEHYTDRISTFPFRVKILNECKYEAFSKGDIVVDDDAWVGYGSIIMSGVHIGQGAVVAAGSVVTKDVPPYAIVGGVPAKVIKYRFDNEIIKELLKLDFGKLDKSIISKHISDLCKRMENREQMKWINKMIDSNEAKLSDKI